MEQLYKALHTGPGEQRKACVKAFSNGSIFLTSVSVLLFVGLSVADAWLTNQLLVMDWQEINPVVRPYGTNTIVKGALALAVALVLVRFGKPKLLGILNIFMLVLVLWLTAGLLHIL